ncbi:hypothetical protein P376_4062 [Streptomyces sp. HCCB10043]|nr:hypothetical protein P376_4062 [Streptomyces sp. HCCB10043]
MSAAATSTGPSDDGAQAYRITVPRPPERNSCGVMPRIAGDAE